MNPCAPTFVPTLEEGFSSGEDSSLPPSRDPKLPGREDSLKPHRSKELPSITVDSDQYDTMFPALEGVHVDGRKIRSPIQVKRRDKKSEEPKLTGSQIRRSTPGGEDKTVIEYEKPEDQEAEDDNESENGDTSSDEVEYLKPTVYTPRKSLEYLQPTVYTPPTSSQESRRRSGIGRRTARSAARNRSKSPRVAWRPPTPHPEGKPRASKSRRSPTPTTHVNGPARYPSSAPYPPPPYNHYYPGHHTQVPQQHVEYGPIIVQPMSQLMVPPVLSYASWSIPSLPWSVPGAQPTEIGYPPGFEYHNERPYGAMLTGHISAVYGPPPPQAYPHPQPQVHQQLQQSQAETERDTHIQTLSPPSTETDDTTHSSHSKPGKSRHRQKKSISSSGLANDGTAIITPLKTQMMSVPAGKDRRLLGVGCNDDTKREQIGEELREVAEHTKATGFIPTRQVKSAQDSPSALRAAKINIKRESQPQTQEKTQETDQKPSKAPQNAPTGPSSLRSLPQSFSATVKKALNLNKSDSGAWSQSKSWTSFATKERQAFQKMMANLRYMSADQSPFVPQSPAELTAFKAALAESKTKKLGQEVRQRLAETNAKTAKGSNKNEPMMEVLGGKDFEDHLSPVFAVANCFNKAQVRPPYRADWPSLAELKEEGDKRANRQGRCLPLPRMDFVASKFFDAIDEAYNSDGSIRWDRKAVQVGLRYICPIAGDEHSMTPPIELQTDEAPSFLACLLHYIDAVEDETKEVEEEKKSGKENEVEKKETAK
ncbi:uncharacterized protein FIESC28_10338 [Fusarium coffeatum]|uniref:Uncharacterized protein n=1 Tax=Fusarium coffeatum TaxID=231269 RepID=A0A366QVJ8_9HYPO|nr:uncharacterized protein FIESC28_10338 [Fusarium coffeatum]RBR08146.1 hypothetical protein FIESC28_10338 [Fusarium coffeatum]